MFDRKEYMRQYYLKHREEIRAKRREWWKKNRGKNNPEKKKYHHEYYLAHQEELKAKARARYKTKKDTDKLAVLRKYGYKI